jgi:hypothetical protein
MLAASDADINKSLGKRNRRVFGQCEARNRGLAIGHDRRRVPTGEFSETG